MTDARISLDGVKAGYGTRVVLDNVCFNVMPGHILTLLGPNGSGKSTLIKTISGQIASMGGTVLIENNNTRNLNQQQIARHMSVMLTERPDPEFMTCREVVEMGRIPYTGTFGRLSTEDNKMVESAIEMVNIRELSKISFRNISDGQRQRVMLARAIAQDPSVLIMDEPTTFLDIRYKIELLTILKNLVQKKKIAVILSLHELELAGKISDEVICVNDGKVCAYGTVEEVFQGDRIQNLYGIKTGRYIESYGSVELTPVTGEPKVFVIAGGGSGINTYHRLWRKDIPFACGIMQENDMEYPIASVLSRETVSAPAFEPAGDNELKRAKALIDATEETICNIESFGSYNQINKELRDYAVSKGKFKNG